MNWKSVLSAVALVAAPIAQAQIEVDLDGAKGHIHKVDLDAKSFQLLKETEYDPKSDITQSRFTVHWDENTTVVAVEERKSFEGIEGPVPPPWGTATRSLVTTVPPTSRVTNTWSAVGVVFGRSTSTITLPALRELTTPSGL